MFKKNKKESVEINAKVSQPLSNKEKLDAAKQKNVKLKNDQKQKRTKTILLITVLVIVIIAAIVSISTYMDKQRYKPYYKYEEKMKIYGFDKLYDDKSAKTAEPVTKAEALKLAIGAVFNTSDISGFAAEHNEYPNAIWVEYAKAKGITIEDINASNYNHKASYVDVITYFENCKKLFLKDQKIEDTTTKLKDISKYTTEQQAAIKDMLANQIIAEVSSNLNGSKTIFKGQLNEIVVNFVEKYNTIAMAGYKLNINPEKIPSNANLYPYTVTAVDKSVYEAPLSPGYDAEKISPKDLYSFKKELYPEIKLRCEEYFDTLINVDYRTINEQEFSEKVNRYFLYQIDEATVKNYVNYVKDNQIVIEGKSEAQIPVIFFDGVSYRARLKLTFDVKSSKTKVNLLFLDMLDNSTITYANTTYSILVDNFMSNAIGDSNMYLDSRQLYDMLVDKTGSGIAKTYNISK